ncbi:MULTISPECIES: dsDNA nuclease domain-containing protein [Paenibacillus]|uniref:dsDNA nuclease domain-containing protein n=1 Tax=Paenibacillus TaxID=44249 RepID=UPI003008502E
MDDKELEQGLLDKVSRYSEKNLNVIPSEEEARCAVRYLLHEDPDDLGGLTALRGFVYQYYVAIHYIVEMLHEENVWWSEVIFEFLDDVALLSNEKIRFVQVKTVREDGQDRHLTASTLLKRDSGLDSWLDTLFLNLPSFELRLNTIPTECDIAKEFGVQFEIATNASYDNKGLKCYAQNDTYQLSDIGNIKDENLAANLNKPFIKTIKEKGKVVSTETIQFHELAKHDPEWFLQRFYLNHLGCMTNLKEKIIGKLSDYCKRGLGSANKLLHTESQAKKRLSGDGLFYDYVARKVFKQLLLRVIERTHNDDLPDKMLLVFNKNEITEWIHDWQQNALMDIQRDVEQAVQRGQFVKCFEELREEIDASWNTSLKVDLMNTIGWMYDNLEHEVLNGNPYVYEQFLNRLFYLNNSQLPSLQRMSDEFYLKESLKYMMICLAFYPDRNFLFHDAQLLFKQGKQGDEAWSIFTMYNAREKENYSHALRKIISRSRDCMFTQSLQQTYYCFVTNEDKTPSVLVENDPFAALIPITHNHDADEGQIIDQPQHIKFQKQDKINLIINRFNDPANFRTFSDHQMREAWHKLINTKDE